MYEVDSKWESKVVVFGALDLREKLDVIKRLYKCDPMLFVVLIAADVVVARDGVVSTCSRAFIEDVPILMGAPCEFPAFWTLSPGEQRSLIDGMYRHDPKLLIPLFSYDVLVCGYGAHNDLNHRPKGLGRYIVPVQQWPGQRTDKFVVVVGEESAA